MNKSKLNVLYLSDDNYAVFAGVSILSLLVNNQNLKEICIYLIDDGISSINRRKLFEMVDQFNRTLVILDMSSGIKKLIDLKAPKYRGSYTTYLKLFAFQLLPNDIEKVFFIDSDTIVQNLETINTTNMGGKVIAAVRDGLSSDYKCSLGFHEEEPFFNMGVMLVDIVKWKKNNCENRVVAQMNKRVSYVAVDQDILNITFKGEIASLEPKYNFTPHHYIYKYKSFMRAFKQGGFYNEKEMFEGTKYPAIYHFERFMGESPWHFNSIHPFVKLFDFYLQKSPWKDYKKQKANSNLILKIEKFVYMILPHNCFIYIFSVGYKKYMRKTFKDLSVKNVDNIKI